MHFLSIHFTPDYKSIRWASLVSLISCLLIIWMANPILAQEENPCMEDETGYALRISAAPTDCNGAATGSAVVTSDRCSCFHSACTFLWSDGQTFHSAYDLKAGWYWVTVTAPNGCIQVDSIEVTQPAAFVDAINVEDVGCDAEKGGSIAIKASPDAGTLKYLWSDGSTSETLEKVAPGTYTVTITNFVGCEYVETIEVKISDQANPPQIEMDIKETCEGGSSGQALVKVEGGNPPFSYLWNDATDCTEPFVRNLPAGAYEVTITDAQGCVFVRQAEVPAEAFEVNIAANQGDAICPGEPVELTASGAFSYRWMGEELDGKTGTKVVVYPTSSTTYEVIATNSEGCQRTIEYTVPVKTAPMPVINAWNTEICKGESTQLIATINTGMAESFSWSPATGLNKADINSPLASPAETTTYEVRVFDQETQCTTTANITITVAACATALEDVAGFEHYQLYSDFVGNTHTVDLAVNQQVQLNVKWMAANGQVLGSLSNAKHYGQAAYVVDLQEEASGIYFIAVEVIDTDGIRHQLVDKVIKY